MYRTPIKFASTHERWGPCPGISTHLQAKISFIRTSYHWIGTCQRGKTKQKPPTAPCKNVKTNRIVQMCVHFGDLQIRIWFEVHENITVELLIGKNIINRCIWGIIVSERETVPWHLFSLEIISTQPNGPDTFVKIIFSDKEGQKCNRKWNTFLPAWGFKLNIWLRRKLQY